MDKLEEFINNVMCRRESNQHKAHLLWESDIRYCLDEDFAQLFRSDWNHYAMQWGNLDPDDFAGHIEDLKREYKK